MIQAEASPLFVKVVGAEVWLPPAFMNQQDWPGSGVKGLRTIGAQVLICEMEMEILQSFPTSSLGTSWLKVMSNETSVVMYMYMALF